MALIKCPECGKENSSDIKSCLQCGKKLKKKKFSILRVLFLLFVVGALALYLMYLSLPEGKKKMVEKAAGELARSSAVVQKIVPWEERAKDAIMKMPNKDRMAKTIIKNAHPTGKFRKLLSSNAFIQGKTVIFHMDISWSGGFTNNLYKSVFEWKLNKNGHIRAVIIKETSRIKIHENRQRFIDEDISSLFPIINDVANGKKSWK